MQKRYYIIIAIILIIIILLLVFINSKDEKNIINNIENNNIEDISNLEKNEIKNIIEQVSEDELKDIKEFQNSISSVGNPNIYKIEEEHDGRKILQIKPEVQYVVALAGIVKNDIPTEEEVYTLLEQAPRHNGIWIEKNSREDFMVLLQENNINNFKLNKEGYLECNKKDKLTEQEQKLEEMINSGNLYIIDISGNTYQRDYLTGEIIKYPFEDMDPYQVIELYKVKNSTILAITSNKENKLEPKEILNAILQNS